MQFKCRPIGTNKPTTLLARATGASRCFISIACSFLIFSAAGSSEAWADDSIKGDASLVQKKKQEAQALLSPPMAGQLDPGRAGSSASISKSTASAPKTGSRATKAKSISSQESPQQKARELLKEGARFHRSGNDKEAQRLFETAAAIDPHNPDCFFNLGALAEGRSDYLVALAHYRAGLNLRPNDRDLMEASRAMEVQLSRRVNEASSPSQTPVASQARQETAPEVKAGEIPELSDPFKNSQLTEVNRPEAPALSVNPPALSDQSIKQNNFELPVEPRVGNEPFQLHSQQIDTTGSGQPAGTATVFNPPHHRARTVARAAGVTLGVVLGVGMAVGMSAARGSMHCPRCHILHF